MRTHKSELAVGMMVIVAAIALFFLAMRVSGLADEMQNQGYSIKAHFDNIGGLTKRAKVTMSGVQIGRVTDISLDPKRLDAVVTMQIDNSMKQIDEGSIASILTAGLLGEKYIGITVGAEDEMLGQGGVIEQTQSALVLEELISKFLFNKTQETPKGADTTATPATSTDTSAF